MKTYIALLRGVNVGGYKKLPMVELRSLFSELGFEKTQTYIQSGNVVFKSKLIDVKVLKNEIEQAILRYFKFEVSVLVISPKDLKQFFDDCPFLETQKTNSYFMFLFDKPNKDLVKKVSGLFYPNETFVITKTVIYFYSSVGYGKAKCNNSFFEKKLNITTTTRNYKTIIKLLSLSTE